MDDAEITADHAALAIEPYIVAMFDEKIEDMLADEWRDPLDVVDLAEIFLILNVARVAEGRPRVVLPFTMERQLIESAKRGMRKGGGQRHPRNSHITTLRHELIAGWAKDRWRQLEAQGETNLDAKHQAAKEAAAILRKHDLKKLKAVTIGRLMDKSPDA